MKNRKIDSQICGNISTTHNYLSFQFSYTQTTVHSHIMITVLEKITWKASVQSMQNKINPISFIQSINTIFSTISTKISNPTIINSTTKSFLKTETDKDS